MAGRRGARRARRSAMAHWQLLLLAAAAGNPPGQPNPHRLFSSNPLAGLPALRQVHHSFGNCRASELGSPWPGCPYAVDSQSALQQDFARITHAWPLEIGWGGGFHLQRDDAGNPLWDEAAFESSQNKTEVVEAVRLCAKVADRGGHAQLTVTFSPWSMYWGSSVRPTASAAAKRVAASQCPRRSQCDPTVRGPSEELELEWYRRRLANISAWMEETNAALGTNVTIGGVLLDCEVFLIDQSNQTMQVALTRKHDLVYNVSRMFCHESDNCTVQQYNRGTQGYQMTLDHDRIPTSVEHWPGYARCDPKTGFRGGLGDTYGTSLYTLPEYEGTRLHYRQTVAEQMRCESVGIRHVTPWLWIGGGYRRVVVPGRPGAASGDMLWDYSLAYSWMIGREIADPFYSTFPDRYAPWSRAQAVVLFPNPFSPAGMTEPPLFHQENGTLKRPGDIRSSVILKHLVGYVLGAANIVDRINNTINTVLPPPPPREQHT
eukprot:SAG22_NODE_407_length_10957_cov_5.081691_1_plen_489_part_00